MIKPPPSRPFPENIVNFHAALRAQEPERWRAYRAAAALYPDVAGGAGPGNPTYRHFTKWIRVFERLPEETG